jgi:BirA family transcriptional regulator, biotin operon repressor / biotin---[acetyl-CoA-carboxylase] ligase
MSAFAVFDSLDSTNNYAMGEAQRGMAEHGNVYMALEQTAGKGRRNKRWVSHKAMNITLSITVDTSTLPLSAQFGLSMSVALGCRDFFNKYAGDNTCIKWPNDLYFNDNKAGGILIENIINGNKWQWAVVGIGINVNQLFFTDESSKATSLRLITRKEYDIIKLARELHTDVIGRLNKLRTISPEELSGEYNRVLYKKDQKVRLKKGSMAFETTIKGVTTDGQLLTYDVMERSFGFDEVEWI